MSQLGPLERLRVIFFEILSPQELLGLGLFGFVVAVIPLLFILDSVFFLVGRRKSLWRHWKLMVAFIALEAIGVLYGRFVEPTWMEFPVHQVSSRKLPDKAAFRIAHLSDLHLRNTSDDRNRLDQVFAELDRGKPDLILLTGDYASSRDGLPLLASVGAELRKRAPAFAVPGNWDAVYFPESMGILDSVGVKDISGKIEETVASGQRILIGAPWRNFGEFFPRLASETPGVLSIVLFHTPDCIDSASWAGADLYFCGHTHGGQIRIPFYGALATLTKTGKRYEAGLYRAGNLVAYTNRGIGLEGAGPAAIRFLCRPEVAFFDIVGTRGP